MVGVISFAVRLQWIIYNVPIVTTHIHIRIMNHTIWHVSHSGANYGTCEPISRLTSPYSTYALKCTLPAAPAQMQPPAQWRAVPKSVKRLRRIFRRNADFRWPNCPRTMAINLCTLFTPTTSSEFGMNRPGRKKKWYWREFVIARIQYPLASSTFSYSPDRWRFWNSTHARNDKKLTYRL